MSTPRLLVVMDPIAGIKPYKDSSFAMLLEAQARGWPLRYAELPDLYWRDGVAALRHRSLTVTDQTNDWFELGNEQDSEGRDFDVILMRKDPPLDMEYIAATWWLDAAEGGGALVVNRPQALRDWNEKLATSRFAQCCPPTLVSRDPERLNRFIDTQRDVIVKPLDGMGGAGIFRLRHDDPNRSVILETSTAHGQTTVMAQGYLADIAQGDKRILIVDGEVIPYALARIPAPGETRANLAVGGEGIGQPLSTRDRWIADEIGPALKNDGLLFAGIDVIGDYLTEINVTSPTGIRELDALYDLNISAQLCDAIEARLAG